MLHRSRSALQSGFKQDVWLRPVARVAVVPNVTTVLKDVAKRPSQNPAEVVLIDKFQMPRATLTYPIISLTAWNYTKQRISKAVLG